MITSILHLCSSCQFKGRQNDNKIKKFFFVFRRKLSNTVSLLGVMFCTLSYTLWFQEAIFIGPATVIPGMLFSGFFLPIPLVPEGLSWLSYLSHVRYAFESFILSVYGFNRENLECSEGLCLFQSPDLLLAHLDMEETSLLMSISSLAIFLLVLRTLCFFGLKWKINRCLQN